MYRTMRAISPASYDTMSVSYDTATMATIRRCIAYRGRIVALRDDTYRTIRGRIVRYAYKEICRVEPDKTEVKAGKHSREDGNELSVPTKTDDIPNGKPCVSGNIFSNSAVGSNSDDRSSMKCMSKCSLELVIDENIDVHTDVAFKANHSALDYSHVSQSEHCSTYLGFAKQSIVSSANEKPDTYDPNRIPASIFSKPQNHMEWSVASNDSPYNVQEKRVDAPQKPPCILAIPRANSMPRHSDASIRSFAFPVYSLSLYIFGELASGDSLALLMMTVTQNLDFILAKR